MALASFHPGERRLVEQDPVKAKLAHRLRKLLEINRFDDITIHPEVVTRDDDPPLPGSPENHDGDLARARVLLDPAQDSQSIDLGQLEIQEYYLGSVLHAAVVVRPLRK